MEEKKKGFFARLKEGLTKTRNSIVSGIDSVFRGFTDIDDDFYEEIEEILIMGDLGVDATEKILTDMKQKVKELHLKEPHECKEVLIDSIRRQMDLGENAYEFEHRKSVVLVIGVNGVGKTTSIGKLADQLKAEGNSVLLAAADTFRAAAIDQLEEWGKRANVGVISHKEGSDPAAVIFDAVQAAKAKQEAFQSVLSDADSFETVDNLDTDAASELLKSNGYSSDAIEEVALGKDKSGETIGYVINVVSHEGYGGDIEISVGIQADGTVKGIEMLSISETAGLGMKSTEPAFKDQFKDKKVETFSYTKTGEEGDDKIDAISGATITTNAVTNAVDSALVYFQNELGGGSNE